MAHAGAGRSTVAPRVLLPDPRHAGLQRPHALLRPPVLAVARRGLRRGPELPAVDARRRDLQLPDLIPPSPPWRWLRSRRLRTGSVPDQLCRLADGPARPPADAAGLLRRRSAVGRVGAGGVSVRRRDRSPAPVGRCRPVRVRGGPAVRRLLQLRVRASDPHRRAAVGVGLSQLPASPRQSRSQQLAIAGGRLVRRGRACAPGRVPLPRGRRHGRRTPSRRRPRRAAEAGLVPVRDRPIVVVRLDDDASGDPRPPDPPRARHRPRFGHHGMPALGRMATRRRPAVRLARRSSSYSGCWLPCSRTGFGCG